MPETTISGEYGFDAPPEVVFGVLTDPHRTTRWLPLGMTAEPSGADEVRVRAGSDLFAYDVDVIAERLRVDWSARDQPGLRGSVWVRDAPAGGSLLCAEVDLPDEGGDRERAEKLLAETVEHLRRDVADNFTTG